MIVLLTLALAGAQTEPSPRGALDYLVGEFRAEVELFDREGNVARRVTSETRAHPIFDGGAIEQSGALLGTGLEARSLYYVDEQTGEIRWLALSSSLEHHVFTGRIEDGGLSLIAEGRSRDGRPLRFKRVDSRVSEEGYTFSMYASGPGEDDWILLNRQFNRRLGRGRVAAEALRSYAGVWIGEEQRESAAGVGYRFRYALEPVDDAGTLFEMTITEEMDDGSSRLVFTGFKDYDRHAEKVRYHAFSPSGRVAHGRVLLVGDALETVYEGRGPDGSVATIKDVFTRLEENRFRSVTYLRPEREAEWRQIHEDHWRRAQE